MWYSKKAKLLVRSTTLAATVLAITACSAGSNTGSSSQSSVRDVNTYLKSNTACSPLEGAGNSSSSGNSGSGYQSIFNETNGLQGRLYYIPSDSQPAYTDVADYISQGTDTGIDVFLNSLNVPTRLFTEGFNLADGTLLNVNGQTLTEYFALFLESELQLSPTDQAGDYQFALLADDGATVQLQRPDGSFYTYLNDDGLHPTQMGCATTPLTLNAYDRIPMRISYYQGPRYEIALQMIFRPVPQDGSLDPLCGANGNSTFYDPNNNSAPTQGWTDLQSRGWKVLQPANFVIPSSTGGVNPCNSTQWQ